MFRADRKGKVNDCTLNYDGGNGYLTVTLLKTTGLHTQVNCHFRGRAVSQRAHLDSWVQPVGFAHGHCSVNTSSPCLVTLEVSSQVNMANTV